MKLSEIFCLDINKNLKLCLTYLDLIKIAGFTATIFALSSSTTDIKYVVVLFILYLMIETILNATSTIETFTQYSDLAINPEIIVPEQQYTGEDKLYPMDPELGLPEMQPKVISTGNPMHKKKKLHSINDDSFSFAIAQNEDFNKNKLNMMDRENNYFRDNYSRGRLNTAMHLANRTIDGHLYGAPQENKILDQFKNDNYMESMGFYTNQLPPKKWQKAMGYN